MDKLHLVLDTIEAYIYSIPRISEEYDLPDRQYIKHGEFASLDWQKFQLEEVQGAYLMIVLQYWTGNTIARTRVRQQRYGRVISVSCASVFLYISEELFLTMLCWNRLCVRWICKRLTTH